MTEDMTKVEQAMLLAKEVEKYHMKVNAMIQVAIEGPLHPAIYVSLMREISDMWLNVARKKIEEHGNKEELKIFNEAIALIKDAKDIGAFKMIEKE